MKCTELSGVAQTKKPSNEHAAIRATTCTNIVSLNFVMAAWKTKTDYLGAQNHVPVRRIRCGKCAKILETMETHTHKNSIWKNAAVYEIYLCSGVSLQLNFFPAQNAILWESFHYKEDNRIGRIDSNTSLWKPEQQAQRLWTQTCRNWRMRY